MCAAQDEPLTGQSERLCAQCRAACTHDYAPCPFCVCEHQRPLLLDLFCCAGGAAMGYHRAGFRVIGVDIKAQPHYPFPFIRADALGLLEVVVSALNGGSLPYYWQEPLGSISAIHASPPCQRYSDLAKRNGNAEDWPDLIEPVRTLLEASGLPYIIENVEGAPLRPDVVLCGTMFPGLRVIRHRVFESNVPLYAPPHGKHPLVFTHDKRKAHYGQLDQDVSFVQVTGGGNARIRNKLDAMGIDWMTNDEVNEAIPPAYTEWLGMILRNAMLDHDEVAA